MDHILKLNKLQKIVFIKISILLMLMIKDSKLVKIIYYCLLPRIVVILDNWVTHEEYGTKVIIFITYK